MNIVFAQRKTSCKPCGELFTEQISEIWDRGVAILSFSHANKSISMAWI